VFTVIIAQRVKGDRFRVGPEPARGPALPDTGLCDVACHGVTATEVPLLRAKGRYHIQP